MPDEDSTNPTNAYISALIVKKYLDNSASVEKKTTGKRRKTSRRLRKNNKTKRRR